MYTSPVCQKSPYDYNSPDWTKQVQVFSRSTLGQALIALTVLWLIFSGRLAWLFDSILILIAIVTLPAVISFAAFRWWLSKQLVTAQCPVCGNTLSVLVKTPLVQCARCSSILRLNDELAFEVEGPSAAEDPFGSGATTLEDVLNAVAASQDPFNAARRTPSRRSNPGADVDPKQVIIEVDAKELD
eukprot:CAMPEP_0196660580 /NCGR_PEP_ID=MMETSP1086-20130531/40465_1 /TAXON_ID=77921 /ORGANISM="Cyanoptyche  gloeocystis , Strain SAG4.97" /LENGTH=185 /DNA_ID=CAMNT_0041995059 /DNA_START=320 /DNA_END=877 /DNA_ORIENTATION=-